MRGCISSDLSSFPSDNLRVSPACNFLAGNFSGKQSLDFSSHLHLGNRRCFVEVGSSSLICRWPSTLAVHLLCHRLCSHRDGFCTLVQVYPRFTFPGWKQLNCHASEEKNTCLRSVNLIGKKMGLILAQCAEGRSRGYGPGFPGIK